MEITTRRKANEKTASSPLTCMGHRHLWGHVQVHHSSEKHVPCGFSITPHRCGYLPSTTHVCTCGYAYLMLRRQSRPYPLSDVVLRNVSVRKDCCGPRATLYVRADWLPASTCATRALKTQPLYLLSPSGHVKLNNHERMSRSRCAVAASMVRGKMRILASIRETKDTIAGSLLRFRRVQPVAMQLTLNEAVAEEVMVSL